MSCFPKVPFPAAVILGRMGISLLACLVLPGCQNPAASRRAADGIDARPLQQARVIYIGEHHDNDAHHRFQLAVLERLRAEGRPLVLGVEMVDVTQQATLDEYLAGRIGWREFSKTVGFSGWEKHSRWYRTIFEWCQRHDVQIVALNAPRTVARKLSTGKPLTAEEARIIPGYPAPAGGFEAFQKLMAAHGGHGDMRRYYAAQRAWDEVMAAGVLKSLSASDATLVVFLGAAHADAKFGVPWYVRRQSRAPQLILLPP
jgi:uncharacterized iron-regulated protein